MRSKIMRDLENLDKKRVFEGECKHPVDSFGHFDTIIRPGDAVCEEDLDVVPKSMVVDTDPVVLLDKRNCFQENI